MAWYEHGYYGFVYLGSRITEIVALIPIVGLTGSFIDAIAKTKHTSPSELVATLVVACLATLWCLLSLTAYDDTHIPYLATAAVDVAFLIPILVVSVLLGQPLSQTTCSTLPTNVTESLLPVPRNSSVDLATFVVADQTTCYELNAAWGLAIALCVLFAASAIASAFLWLGKRRAAGQARSSPEPGFEMMEPSSSKAASSGAPSFADPEEWAGVPPPPPGGSFARHPSPSGSLREYNKDVDEGYILPPVPEESAYPPVVVISRAGTPVRLATPPPARNLA